MEVLYILIGLYLIKLLIDPILNRRVAGIHKKEILTKLLIHDSISLQRKSNEDLKSLYDLINDNKRILFNSADLLFWDAYIINGSKMKLETIAFELEKCLRKGGEHTVHTQEDKENEKRGEMIHDILMGIDLVKKNAANSQHT